MSTCLVTKLPSSVITGGEKLGALHVKVNFESTSQYLLIEFPISKEFSVECDKYVYLKNNSTTYYQGTSFTFTTNGYTRFASFYPQTAGVHEFNITSKYEILAVNFNNCNVIDAGIEYMTALYKYQSSTTSSFIAKTSDFKHTGVTLFGCYGIGMINGDISELPNNDYTSVAIQGGTRAKISGDISKFSGKSTITMLQLSDNNCSGSIETLNELTSATTISFHNNSLVEGDVCTLLAVLWRGKGHTGSATSTVTIQVMGTQCTFNGDPVTVSSATATFSASGVVLTAGSTTYTYNGTSWTKS